MSLIEIQVILLSRIVGYIFVSSILVMKLGDHAECLSVLVVAKCVLDGRAVLVRVTIAQGQCMEAYRPIGLL